MLLPSPYTFYGRDRTTHCVLVISFLLKSRGDPLNFQLFPTPLEEVLTVTTRSPNKTVEISVNRIGETPIKILVDVVGL